MLTAAERVWAFFTPPKSEEMADALELSDQGNYRIVFKGLYDMRIFNKKVALTLTAAAVFVGWMFTPWGFVWAQDQKATVAAAVEQVEKKFDEKIRRVDDKLDTIEKQNNSMQSALNELVSEKVATDICRTYQRWVREPDRAEKHLIRTEVDGHQSRYKSLTGDYYPESRCQ